MKKIIRIIATVLLLLLIFPSCAFAANKEFAKTNKVGVIVGGSFDMYIDQVIEGSTPEYFNTISDMPLALESGKIDAYIDDEMSVIQQCKTFKNIRIEKALRSDQYGFIFNKNNEELCNKMSEFVIKSKNNGRLDELLTIWVDAEDESLMKVDYENLPPINGTINVATTATMQPMVYIKDGKFAGYEVAILADFCKEYGYAIKFSDSTFSSVLASVTTGVSDIGACTITITEERKKSMLFSESHFNASAVSVVRKSDKRSEFTINDFEYSRMGLLKGSSNRTTAINQFPKATLRDYNSNSDLASALEKNRIDSYIVDKSIAEGLIKNYEDQSILTTLDPISYSFAIPKQNSTELQTQLNSFINKIQENGELSEIKNTWFKDDESAKSVDLDSLKKNEKVITFALLNSVNDPFDYIKDGQSLGYEVDIMARFCKEYGYNLDIQRLTYDDLLIALKNGECNIASGTIDLSEEQKEKLLLSNPYYESENVLVIRDGRIVETKDGFFTRIKNSFVKTLITEGRWKLFVNGILLTIAISIVALILGTLLAFILYLPYYKNNPIINKVIDRYTGFVEKTPTVVVLMILYYLIFGKLSISAVVIAAIGISLKLSVRVFDLIKMGVGSISKGQTEAALALGYSNKKTFKKIILPQAIMRVTSGYRGAVVSLIEETSIVGYIAVQDITKVVDIIRSTTYEAFFPLIISTIIYILISIAFITLIKKIEIEINPKRRKEKDILKGIKR